MKKMVIIVLWIGFLQEKSFSQVTDHPFIFIPKNTICVSYQQKLSAIVAKHSKSFVNTTSYYGASNSNEGYLLTILSTSDVNFSLTNTRFLSQIDSLSNSNLRDSVMQNWGKDSIAIIRSKIDSSGKGLHYAIENSYFKNFPDSSVLKTALPDKFVVDSVSSGKVTFRYKDFQSDSLGAKTFFFSQKGIYIDPNRQSSRSKATTAFPDSVEIKANASGGYTVVAFLPMPWLKKEFAGSFDISDSPRHIKLTLKNNRIEYKPDTCKIISEVDGLLLGRVLRNRYKVVCAIKPDDFTLLSLTASPISLISNTEVIIIRNLLSTYENRLRGQTISLFNEQYPLEISHQSGSAPVHKWLQMSFAMILPDFVIITNELSDEKMH